jgi:hypothetical protein
MKFGICDDNWNVLARFAVPMTVNSNQPVFSTDTLSLHRRTTVRGAQRWEISSNVEILRETAAGLFAHLVEKGHHTPINVLIPQNIGVIENMREAYEDPIPRYIGISQRQNSADGKATISLQNHTVELLAGTFVQFITYNSSGVIDPVQDTKVYMLTRPVTANNNIAYVYPQLRKTGTVGSQSKMYYTGVKMPCYYDMDTIQGMVYQDGLLMDMGTVKLVEALA